MTIWTLTCAIIAIAQDGSVIDSLVQAYENNRSRETAQMIFDVLVEEGEVKEDVSKMNSDDLVDAKVYEMYSQALYYENKIAQAVHYAKIEEKYAKKLNDKDLLSSSYMTISSCFRNIGAYQPALEYAKKCFEIDKEIGNKDNLSSTLNLLATIYCYSEDYDNAEKCILEAIHIEEDLKRNENMSIRYGNAADIYFAKKNFAKSYDYAQKGYRIDSVDNRIYRGALRMMQMALAKEKMGDSASCVALYKKTINGFKLHGNKKLLANCLFKLGQCDEALETAQKIKDYKLQIDIYRSLKDKESDANKIIYYLSRIRTLQDSISVDENRKNTERFNIQYETIQKDYEILQQKSELYFQRKRVNLTFGLLVLVLVLIFVSIRGWVRNHKNKKLQITANNVKDRILSVISHDMSGTTSVINSLAHKAKNEIDDEMSAIMVMQSDTQKSLLDNMLIWAELQREGKMVLNKSHTSLKSLAEEIMEIYSLAAIRKEITLSCQAEEDYYIDADRNMLACILRNILGNAMKFTPKGGWVKIVVRDKCISVSNSGKGIDKETIELLLNGNKVVHTSGTNGEAGCGLGMSIVRDMVKLCNAKLSISSILYESAEFVVEFSDDQSSK